MRISRGGRKLKDSGEMNWCGKDSREQEDVEDLMQRDVKNQILAIVC